MVSVNQTKSQLESDQPAKTRLLVSVRNAYEASLAASTNCDIIDLKEPKNGALGAVNLEVADSCLSNIADNIDVSFALGELAHWSAASVQLDWLNRFLASSRQRNVYLKTGLSGLAGSTLWKARWSKMMDQFLPSAKKVVVAYADSKIARSPCVHELTQFAIQSNVDAFLIDTFDKSAGNVFDHLSRELVNSTIIKLRKFRLTVAVAGSISIDLIENYRGIRPDYWAMRGAVCHDGRESQLSAEKIKSIKRIIQCAHSQCRDN